MNCHPRFCRAQSLQKLIASSLPYGQEEAIFMVSHSSRTFVFLVLVAEVKFWNGTLKAEVLS